MTSQFPFDAALRLYTCAPAGQTSNHSRILWCSDTPEGPGTLEVCRVKRDKIQATAWGPGQSWMIKQCLAFVGAADPYKKFLPPPKKLTRQWKAKPFALGRTNSVMDALVEGVFGQKVQTKKAKDSQRLLAKKYGTKAPGPYPGFVLPPAERIAQMSYSQFHTIGVERKRALALIRSAKELVRHPEIVTAPVSEFRQRFEQIPGVGPWTTNVASTIAYGDADAIPIGDYHLPNTVSWNLAGEPRSSDKRMLELLAPFKGNRWRVIRLTKANGPAPKYGPRLSLTSDGLSRGY